MNIKNLPCETGTNVTVTRDDLVTSGDSGVKIHVTTDMSGVDENELITVSLRLKKDGTLYVTVIENTTGQPCGTYEVKARSQYPNYVKMLADGYRHEGDWHTANALLETVK